MDKENYQSLYLYIKNIKDSDIEKFGEEKFYMLLDKYLIFNNIAHLNIEKVKLLPRSVYSNTENNQFVIFTSMTNIPSPFIWSYEDWMRPEYKDSTINFYSYVQYLILNSKDF